MSYKLLLPCLLFLCSCEEIIRLDLEPGQQRNIIEANLDASSGICKVSITKSGDFYQTNDFELVGGADVALLLPGGETRTLAEQHPGQYIIEGLDITSGDTIQLHIILPDGSTIHSAPVVAGAPVQLDMLEVEKTALGGPGAPPGSGETGQYSLTAIWNDEAGMENWYRLKIYRNGELEKGTYILADDRLGDGLTITRPVIRQTFNEGDTLRVQLLSVSKAYYAFFTDLANSDGRGLSAPAPYNPQGNLDNEAIGYFGIWYISEKTIIAH